MFVEVILFVTESKQELIYGFDTVSKSVSEQNKNQRLAGNREPLFCKVGRLLVEIFV